jgi:hypothetical protein
VQHHTFLSESLKLQQVQDAVSATATAVARAVLLHACCYVAVDDAAAVEEQIRQQLIALQQQQQQQQQQPNDQRQEPASGSAGQQNEQQSLLSVLDTRPVAVHTLGASFWFPVPTIECCCCAEKWEVKPAAAGFFGCTPTVPYTWFSQQLLDLYTPLSTSGASITSMATALDMINVRQTDAELKIKPW